MVFCALCTGRAAAQSHLFTPAMPLVHSGYHGGGVYLSLPAELNPCQVAANILSMAVARHYRPIRSSREFAERSSFAYQRLLSAFPPAAQAVILQSHPPVIPAVADFNMKQFNLDCSFATEMADLFKGKLEAERVIDVYINLFLSTLDPHSMLTPEDEIKSMDDVESADSPPKIFARGIELEGGILLIQTTEFGLGISRQIRDILLAHPKTKGIILDLRGNPGGYLDEAVKVIDLFVDQGLVVSEWGRNNTLRGVAYAIEPGAVSGAPLAVLVNRYSASASEIVAQSLSSHDYRRAVLVGETTWGKGSVSMVYRLANRKVLMLTEALYYTVSGFTPHGVGVEPDIYVKDASAEANANQLRAAGHPTSEHEMFAPIVAVQHLTYSQESELKSHFPTVTFVESSPPDRSWADQLLTRFSTPSLPLDPMVYAARQALKVAPCTPTPYHLYRRSLDAGWSSLVARRAHNPKVLGSNPSPATKFGRISEGLVIQKN